MSRPIRILKAGTCYVVSHRLKGDARFDHDTHFLKHFTDSLDDLPTRFDLKLHAYAIDDRQYFLYLKTDKSNLDQFMHQFHIRLSQFHTHYRFKNRYRAIAVEPQRYRKAILRFLHQAHFATSSKMYYTTHRFPSWLCELSLDTSDSAEARFEEVCAFFNKERWPAILGTRSFERQLLRGSFVNTPVLNNPQNTARLHPEDIILAASKFFTCTPKSITDHVQRGRGHFNPARLAAITLCRDLLGMRLQDIADRFHFKHPASISHASQQWGKHLKQDPTLEKVFDALKNSLRTKA